MTEDEWLTSTDPKPVLAFLRGKASERKLRLYACALCRRVWHLLIDERSYAAPFAWCTACETYLNEHGGDVQELGKVADFKIICAKCWDEAKAVLYDRQHR